MSRIPKWGLLSLFISAVWLAAGFVNPPPSVTPQPTPTVDRLAAPEMPSEPSQADLGAQVYYQVCMACHGDKGQGLTDEWRQVWGQDSNCWKSKCHSFDHPPQGFHLIETCCKAVIGPNTLPTLHSAQELFTYLTETMPWWNPGSLKQEEYWQLTAYLMRENSALPDGVTLGPGNASVFQLHAAAPPPGNKRPILLLVSGVLALAAGTLAISNRLR